MVEYQLMMATFWLSLTAQWTVVTVLLWETQLAWSRVRLALMFAPLLAIAAFALMAGIAVLSAMLAQRKIIRKDSQLHHFGWLLLGALAYSPFAVVWLRVMQGWGNVSSLAVGLVAGIVGGAVITLLMIAVMLAPLIFVLLIRYR